MTIEPRETIGRLSPVVHGGPDQAELERLGLRIEDLIDFSSNTNPLGPSPAALQAARRAELGRYPDRQSLLLRRALAAEHSLAPEQILIANGSAELIWLLALAYLRPGDPVFVLEPTFGEYQAAARLLGAEGVEWRASETDDFVIHLEAVARAVASARPRLTFVCNPNNPTGAWLTRSDLEQVLAATGEGLLVVDEAYLELSGRESPALGLLSRGNVVLLRSMTKDHGLPGLRLGYALAASETVAALAAAQPPWSVNAAAQAAGLAALSDLEHVAAGRRVAAEARAFVEPRLEDLGYRCLPSVANFWLVSVGDAPTIRRHLLERGILVRDCSSFGLPGYIRLAARPLAECERLIQALATMPAG